MEGWSRFTLLVCMTVTITSATPDDLTIRTTHGDVRGLVTSVLGRQVKVYWGIPYAKIPSRFRRPERAEAWEGVLQATTPPPSCPEVPYTGDVPLIPPPSTDFEENCLFVNLWVPTGCTAASDEAGLAVMVWIHGGGLQFGSSTVPTYNGQVLAATQCVIVASLNYRLGVLGFLTVGSSSAPGNMGLVDQAMALQWIHDNARSFGGAPDRITLFGESAGGLSVGAHMVSPLSQHLFSRAIIQSGPTTSSWAKHTVSQNVNSGRKLAALMGCPVDDDDVMITCLSEADSTEMGQVASDLNRFDNPAFGVIVDGYFLKKPLAQPFLSKDTKKFSIMVGATRDDGSFVVPLMTGRLMNQSSRPPMDRDTFHQELKNRMLPLVADLPERESLAVQLVEYIYINSMMPDKRDDYYTVLENIAGDQNFVCPMYTTVASLPDDSRVFMYSFEHRSSVSPFPEWMGVVHASELDFVFGRPLDQDHLFTDEERQLSSLMMIAWANFAKFGNPNGDDEASPWPALNNVSFPYAVLRSPSHVTVGRGLRYRECTFWNDVYPALVNTVPASSDVQNHDEL